MYSAKRRIEEQSHLDYAKAFPSLRAVAMNLDLLFSASLKT